MLRVATVVLLLVLAAPAQAVERCGQRQTRTILSGQGLLESVVGGPDGALYYTDSTRGALMRLDAPGAEPEVVADGIEKPGGLLVGEDRRSIVVGYGNGFAEGAAGNLVGLAGLLRVDLVTGERTTIAAGTSMSNGLARDPAGAIYASDDAGTGIDRVVGGRVQRNWARVTSGNGLAVSRDGRWLFVNQTFQPAAIRRVDITQPDRVEQYAAPGPADAAAGLDGLTIDQHDRLFAAANAAGEVWRVDRDRDICALASGLGMPSAVAFGGGGAFPATNLYAVTFGGDVVEIPGVRESAPRPELPFAARLRLRVRPRLLRAGVRTRMTIRVRRGRVVEPGARVRAGRKVRTADARGRVRVTVRPRRPGILRVRARAAGVPAVAERVRVLRRAKRPQAVTGP
jgi:sugar lactone lactonase YvrE